MEKITRRLFLRKSAVVGAAATVAVPVTAEAAPTPVLPSNPIFARYVAFLAHEHRAALKAMNRDIYQQLDAEGASYPIPMFWFPEDPNVTTMIGRGCEPERRARAVLHAVGLPIPPKSWF
ncbi:MAG: twin-arginine translocation signal domain-containing protein [Mesorhizobium sp.]